MKKFFIFIFLLLNLNYIYSFTVDDINPSEIKTDSFKDWDKLTADRLNDITQ